MPAVLRRRETEAHRDSGSPWSQGLRSRRTALRRRSFPTAQAKHNHDQQSAWSRFETELAKRTAEIRERHKDELRSGSVRQGRPHPPSRRLPERSRATSRAEPATRRRNVQGGSTGKTGGDQLRGRSADVGGHRSQREACQERRLHLGVSAIPAALRWSRAFSWTTRTRRLSARATSRN